MVADILYIRVTFYLPQSDRHSAKNPSKRAFKNKFAISNANPHVSNSVKSLCSCKIYLRLYKETV